MSNLSLLFKVLLFRIKKPGRFRKLTLETERTLIFRIREPSRIAWCQQCEAEVEQMSVVDAAYETGISELAIYQLIESGDLHFIEDSNRHIVACLGSLRCIQGKLDDEKAKRRKGKRS